MMFTHHRSGWLAVLSGLVYSICFPPFNHEAHWLLAAFPLLGFVVLVPLFTFATELSVKSMMVKAYLFGIAASASQFYWITFDTAEGVWHMILLGVFLLCALFGGYYLFAGLVFRLFVRLFPRAYIILFPCFWVVLEYVRTLGEISFPWMLLGYAMAPILPLAQVSSVGGIYGLSFIVILGNVLVWRIPGAVNGENRGNRIAVFRQGMMFVFFIVLVFFWGTFRLATTGITGRDVKVSCVQPGFNYLKWKAGSLDTAFAVVESLTYCAAEEQPECIVMPESALLCYLTRRPDLRRRVLNWSDSTGIPMIIGAMHWEPAAEGSPYRYLVYNTAFLVDTGVPRFHPYFKMKLVPFSEALPFEGLFPILSRVNLGQSDFKKGVDPVVFSIGGVIRAVPLICYEIIYPQFVRSRLGRDNNLLVNITNDAWFGRSSGPYQHAAMARLRCIENGVSMVRCANTGISMLVDPLGRVTDKTPLNERMLLTGDVPLIRRSTLYSRFGDWVVAAAAMVLGSFFAVKALHYKKRPGTQACR